MHYHLEVIMPPTDDVEAALDKILAPFDENGEDEDGEPVSIRNAFWDWWQIGGRWSGHKMQEKLDKDKLDDFWKKLQEMKITVSGLVAGKQTLNPKSQIPVVDALWCEWFPESGVNQCPLFDHFDAKNNMDICKLSDVVPNTTAYHLIIAVKKFYNDELGAETMYLSEVWNGVTFQETTWDGNILKAVEMHNERLKTHCNEENRERYTPQDDWLVVTVDYHS